MNLSYHGFAYYAFPLALDNAETILLHDLEAITPEEAAPRRSWRDALKKLRGRNNA